MFCEIKNELYNDLPLLPERTKIEKVRKLVANLHNKTEYIIHIHRVIKFNQNACENHILI